MNTEDPPPKKKKMQYDRGNLRKAYDATKNGMSVCRAARIFCVPESTLRDRTKGVVPLDPTIGFETIFSTAQEKKLVEHINYMANIGYGYSKVGVQFMAREFAESLGKNLKSVSALSNCWFYGLLKRWPDIKIIKDRKLSLAKAQAASQERLDNYFKELSNILSKNGLKDKPEHIYCIDEIGINTENVPQGKSCDKSTKQEILESSRSNMVTIIAGGNAIGNNIPPYYIFPGKSWNFDFLNGSFPGSSGENSESGFSNTKLFNKYVTNHFVKFANISVGKDQTPTLLLYDGLRSHINLTLTEWAKKHNIILFVLPPRTNHLPQPLDIAIFGPLKSMYHQECELHLERNPEIAIGTHLIPQLTCKPYMRSLTPENLISVFKNTGIYPLDKDIVTTSQLPLSLGYEIHQLGQSLNELDEETVEHIAVSRQDQECITNKSFDIHTFLCTDSNVSVSVPSDEPPVFN